MVSWRIDSVSGSDRLWMMKENRLVNLISGRSSLFSVCVCVFATYPYNHWHKCSCNPATFSADKCRRCSNAPGRRHWPLQSRTATPQTQAGTGMRCRGDRSERPPDRCRHSGSVRGPSGRDSDVHSSRQHSVYRNCKCKREIRN